MTQYHDQAQSLRDAEILANTLGRTLDAILGLEFGKQVRTINPAPVTTTEVSPASPGADLCSTPPDAEADGGDFSEVTK